MIRPAACACALALALPAARASAFDPQRVGFTAEYRGESSRYGVNAVFLMPGETLDLHVKGDAGAFTFADPSRRAVASGAGRWTWSAPDSAGLYPMTVSRGTEAMLFNVFVMVPATAIVDEAIQGYRIGAYPKAKLRGLGFYAPPRGFIRLDSISAEARISPHFRLGQFACKQSSRFPAFLALKERLILKLELVLEKANEAGYACETFHVMSGYRTPFYNKLIGNVKQSAHLFGGAADIFIDDNPVDGEMDDLNRDGRSDGDDSESLFKVVDAMSLNEFYLPYLGGIGKYSKNQSHGAFVHVDVRGFRAIW